MERDLLKPRIVERAIARAEALLTESLEAPRRDALEHELATVEREIARLTEAVASGGTLSSLVQALQARDARRTELRRHL
ncbi:MAG: hypothetical protein U0132_23815, partial [Gemmatimonadaceae bacterium]